MRFRMLRSYLFSHVYAYMRTVHAKKPAKVQLFFDIAKLFGKKIQKKCILHDLFGILGIMGLHNWRRHQNCMATLIPPALFMPKTHRKSGRCAFSML